jgi:quercetin dioxygenase-like cupin family protein
MPASIFRAAALCLLLGASAAASAQTSSPAANTHRVPQFENDAVKVWRTIIEPGTPLPLHHHDHPRVLVALSPGTLKIVEQSGETQTIVLKVGEAYWLPAMSKGALHQDVNASGQPIEVMVVELEKEK